MNQHLCQRVRLAAVIFSYTGMSDFMKCVYCGLVLEEWLRGDKLKDEHRRNYPHCSSLQRLSEKKEQESKGEDVCGRYETFNDLVSHDPSKAIYKERLETFNTWPLKQCHSPSSSAVSGFFYRERID